MSQLDGGITVDEGYREIRAGNAGSGSSSVVRSFDPADHGDESLGVEVYGSDLWHAPGFGDPHPDCGSYRVEGVCESCGHAHVAPHQCGRRSCPNCAGIWAKQAAMKRVVRLQSVRYTESHKQAGHGVVSLDRDMNTVRGYLQGRSDAAEIAKEKGWRHFDIVAHPARVTDEGKELFDQEAGDDDPGIHVWLQQEYPDRYHFGEPDSLLYWSPHYHVIGVTSPDMEPAKESDSFVYKFIDSLGRFDLHDEDSFNDLYSVYRYLFSHVGIHEERQFQAVVGYGGMSNTTHEEYQPTAGILRKIEEMTEKVADRGLDRDDEPARAGSEDDELGECSECDDGVIINIFRVPDYIEQAQPPPDIRDKMITAYEWRTGEIQPPPGLKRPQSDEEAREALRSML